MLNINSGKSYVKVFRNEKDGNVWYNASISRKLEDGSYSYMPKLIKFKNNEDPGVTCKIIIKNAFISFYETNDGVKKDYIMVLDYETDEEVQNNTDSEFYNNYEDFNGDVELSDDLPF